MKGKNIFKVAFTTFILILTVMIVSLYDNIRQSSMIQEDEIVYRLSDEFQTLTLDLAMQLDENFQPTTDVDDLALLKDDITVVRNIIHRDPAFFYIAKNTKNNQVVTNIKNYDEKQFNVDAYSPKIHLNYDKDGYCIIDNNINSDLFNHIELNDLEEELASPTNLDIYYLFDASNIQDVGFSSYLSRWNQYNGPISLIFLGSLVLIALFIFLWPMHHVLEVKPFSIVVDWSFEISLFYFAFIDTLLFMGLLVVSGYSMNGELKAMLQVMGLTNIQVLIYVINTIVWLVAFISYALSIFLVKYIMVSGPIQYLKTHTLIAMGWQYFKKQLDLISNIDLTKALDKSILKYTLLNGVAIIFISIWYMPLAIVFTLIYTITLFIYLKHQAVSFQNDYNQLLDCIHDIISEDFDQSTIHDLGIFDSSKEKLIQLSNNFEEAITERVKSEKLKTELITNVSHDLKTPLTCMKNYLVLLENDNLSIEDKSHYIAQLNLYTNRLKRLIDDLFEISKVDSGNISLDLQPLDLVSLLEQIYMENEESLQERDLTLIKKIDEEKIMLTLDSDKTYRIFENLLTNIQKYALPHTRVYLTILKTEQYVSIEFSNISEVPMDFSPEEIKERFVRGDQSRSKQGSGLGLAIARSFTEAQGGQFDIMIDCDLFKVKVIFPIK